MHASNKQKADRERKLAPEEDPEFQIAPMIDILLVLLVFFMSISSTEVLQTNKELILPVAKDAKDKGGDNPSQAIVNVTWFTTGAIDLDSVKYPDPASIVPVLAKKIAASPTLRVLLRSDREVRWEYLRSVLKAVGDAGVSNVTFAVVDKDYPKQ